MLHLTVLREEAVEALNLKPSSIVVDATLGSAGHAGAIQERLGKQGILIGLDADPAAIKAAASLKSTKEHGLVYLKNGNFRHLGKHLSDLKLTSVDAILADLGWRSEQFDHQGKDGRGFSFRADEPLLMTYGEPKNYLFTAADIVNDWPEEDIANVLFGYGEEHYSRRIARAIVEARKKEKITSASDLAELISSAVPKGYARGRRHPATKSFQALRIAVNDELIALEEFIDEGFAHLRVGGRMSIITFHSLEDRIIKEKFRSLNRAGLATLVNRRPLSPSREEVRENPRARSAKLRVIEKL